VAAGGGVRVERGEAAGTGSWSAGVEGTFAVRAENEDCVFDGTCDVPRLRLGPWLGIDSASDRKRGEGGVAFSLAGPRISSLSAFGLRAGAGHATTGETHVVAQLSWGTRTVRMRARGGLRLCYRTVVPASGLRLFVAARREIEGPGQLQVVAGVEWQPLGRWLGISLL
jgi:hypothetical protein